MNWGDITVPVLMAFVVAIVPGVIAARILRLRGFAALGAAAPLSFAGIGLFSLVQIVLPFRWAVWTWLVSVIVLVGAAVVVRLVLRRLGLFGEDIAEPRWWRPRSLAPFVAVGVAAAVLTPRLLAVFGAPDTISQTFDDIYHLNAVRYVLDTGLIAPTKQIIPGFYPSLWHAYAATVAQLSGASIPTVVNATSIVLAAVVWPISAIFLTRQIIGSSVPATLTAAALSVGLAAFPILMIDFGVLYPNELSVSLLPAALALLVMVTRTGAGPRPAPLVGWIVLLATIPALALAHPSTLMAFFAIGVWPALIAGVRWLRAERARSPRSRRRLAIGLGAWGIGLAIVAVLLIKARPTRAQAFWPPAMPFSHAVQDVLLNGVGWRPDNLTATAVMFLGIVLILALRRRWWWLVAGWATIGFLYVVCASFPSGVLRYGLTGTWYSDLFRIASLTPTLVVPLGAIGVGLAAAALVRPLPERAHVAVATSVGAVGAAIVLVLTQTGPAMSAEVAAARQSFSLAPNSPLLSSQEMALLKRLPENVPAGDVTVGSPWTGASLGFVIANRHALVPHIYQELTPDMELILDKANKAASDPQVCAALKRTGVRWVIDFGNKEVHGGNHRFAGLQDLATAPGFVKADSEGPDAVLYRITACD